MASPCLQLRRVVQQSRSPVTKATIFDIGSISKMFTTTLAPIQVTGKLALDEHLGRTFRLRVAKSPLKPTCSHSMFMQWLSQCKPA